MSRAVEMMLQAMYYWYVTLPLAVLSFIWKLGYAFLFFWSRKSPVVRKLLVHLTAIGEVFTNFGHVLTETSISVLIFDAINLTIEVVMSFLDARVSSNNGGGSGSRGHLNGMNKGLHGGIDGGGGPAMSFAELNDLLYYEEMSDEEEYDIFNNSDVAGMAGQGLLTLGGSVSST
jgi:hypothetical protein